MTEDGLQASRALGHLLYSDSQRSHPTPIATSLGM
jgi:hypothetical protein